MIIQLMLSGQIALAVLLIIAIVISLTFHEFGHAAAGKMLGDDTAQKMGRLSLNPLVHIDPLGLLMVATVGFGWAKPVPFDPRAIPSVGGQALVGAAGPAMNLLMAVIAANCLALGLGGVVPAFAGEGQVTFFGLLAVINLLLMLFNLLPIGPLDGHYVIKSILPTAMVSGYDRFNTNYGSMIFLVLIVLSVAGVPIFRFLSNVAYGLLPYLMFLGPSISG